MIRRRRWIWVKLLVVLLLFVWGAVPVRQKGMADSMVALDDETRRVNAPYFGSEIKRWQSAIFWFGQVTPTSNYTDVRVGYSDDELYIHLNVFDRLLWNDPTPSPDDLTAWDAATVYLDRDGNEGAAPDSSTYKIEAQFAGYDTTHEDRLAVYRGSGGTWNPINLPLDTIIGGRGEGFNDTVDDRGWYILLYIPFQSLGLSGPPPADTVWALSLALHDRDDAAGTSIPDQVWPEDMDAACPATWGQLAFGLPDYAPPPAVPAEAITILNQPGETLVLDAHVGGGTNCCAGCAFWTECPNKTYGDSDYLSVGSQMDVADWPCYVKIYTTIPLDDLPPGREIISATLTLHQFGNAGGGAWGDAPTSNVHVLTVAEGWRAGTLTWNNAPLGVQNITVSQVVPLEETPGWPGVPRNWDVSLAVAQAYAASEPLRLALYSSDTAYHSSKYFWSTEAGTGGGPILKVQLGHRLAHIQQTVHPATVTSGGVVTYALSVLGAGQTLTVTDDLPHQVGAPGAVRVSPEHPQPVYDLTHHRLTWVGHLDVGQPLTITFPVPVNGAGPMAVSNTVVLTDDTGQVSSDSAVFILDPRKVFLPLVMR